MRKMTARAALATMLVAFSVSVAAAPPKPTPPAPPPPPINPTVVYCVTSGHTVEYCTAHG